MENQAKVRDAFRRQVAINANIPMPWEQSESASASPSSGTSTFSRATDSIGKDYGVGLPPMAG